MTTALLSALANIPVRRDVAMTGEVTLRGNVLAIGGLKEKSMAAYKAGVKKVIIPAANMKDLDDIDPAVRDAVEFIPVKHANEVLSHALVDIRELKNYPSESYRVRNDISKIIPDSGSVRVSLETAD